MNLAGWRDLSVVLLAAECFVGVLIVGVITYFCIRGIFWVKAQLRAVGSVARYWMARIERGVERAAGIAREPALRAGGGGAAVRAVVDALIGRKRRSADV
jgi:hypothetical protein